MLLCFILNSILDRLIRINVYTISPIVLYKDLILLKMESNDNTLQTHASLIAICSFLTFFPCIHRKKGSERKTKLYKPGVAKRKMCKKGSANQSSRRGRINTKGQKNYRRKEKEDGRH